MINCAELRSDEFKEGPRGPEIRHHSHLAADLDIAQRLVQTRGFNAFSYADIASTLNVSKASLHYHFASKAELGVRLIERYEDEFERLLGGIDLGGGNAALKLQRYVLLLRPCLG